VPICPERKSRFPTRTAGENTGLGLGVDMNSTSKFGLGRVHAVSVPMQRAKSGR